MIGRLESTLLTYRQPTATAVTNKNYDDKIHAKLNRPNLESYMNRSYVEQIHSEQRQDIGYSAVGKPSPAEYANTVGRHVDIIA